MAQFSGDLSGDPGLAQGKYGVGSEAVGRKARISKFEIRNKFETQMKENIKPRRERQEFTTDFADNADKEFPICSSC